MENLQTPDAKSISNHVIDDLKQYSSRDLKHTKFYRCAKRSFTDEKIRSRRITAPLHTSEKAGMWSMSARCTPHSQVSPPTLKHEKKPTYSQREEAMDVIEYDDWLRQRKKMRHELSKMGMSEGYLARKPNLTPIESRLLERMRNARAVKRVKSAKTLVQVNITLTQEEIDERRRRRCTKALQIIEKHIKLKRMRLLDLFKSIDKDKSWTVTRDEFKLAIDRAGIALPGPVMNDLIFALDANNKNELDYRELAKALGEWKITKREVRKKLDLGVNEDLPGFNRRQGILIHSDEMGKTSATVFEQFRLINQLTTRRNTQSLLPQIATFLNSTGQPQHRQQQKERKTEKKIKRQNRVEVIKAITDHSKPSALTDENTADQLNQFRAKQLKEYYKIMELCKERSIIFSDALLEKALLYPADQSYEDIVNKKMISVPGDQLLSCKFAQIKPRLPSPDHTYKRSQSGKLLMDERKFYPAASLLDTAPTRVDLSTGKAYVSRKVDCWLTFEEYCKLTKNIARYRDVSGVKENAFWPGELLDKLRLYMDDEKNVYGANTAFRLVQTSVPAYPGYNSIESWPENESGYVMLP
ncbi:EF-hand calcium-binding domain-containing protein 12-like [Tubulanus polymorphus]|uniref:EF-hand calcium-binding domain-containing protein 12-like n=1 Tax=Tubulanus polymorphus TaxID=672921 RepID=UPI003DA3AD1D